MDLLVRTAKQRIEVDVDENKVFIVPAGTEGTVVNCVEVRSGGQGNGCTVSVCWDNTFVLDYGDARSPYHVNDCWEQEVTVSELEFVGERETPATAVSYQCSGCKQVWKTLDLVYQCPSCGGSVDEQHEEWQ